MRTTPNPAVALTDIRLTVKSGRAQSVREAAGLSQAEVADAIGASPAAVSGWERGVRVPHGAPALRYRDLIVALEERLADADRAAS